MEQVQRRLTQLQCSCSITIVNCYLDFSSPDEHDKSGQSQTEAHHHQPLPDLVLVVHLLREHHAQLGLRLEQPGLTTQIQYCTHPTTL